MAPHSRTLAWKIPSGGLQSMGSQRVRHDWATSLSLFTFMHWRRKWQPTSVFLPGESQTQGSLVGCHLRGHKELDILKQLSSSSSNRLFYSPLRIWSSLCLELCAVILLAHLSSDVWEYSEWIICECTVWHHIDNAVDCNMSSNVRNAKENKCILEGDPQYSLTLDLFGVLSFFL